MSKQGKGREDLDAGWGSGATTEQKMVHPGGILDFAIGQSNATVAIGLASENTDKPFSGIDHAFLFRDDGTVQIYERGVAVNTPRPYVTGNMFSLRIAVVGGLHLVSYVQNDEEIHATRDKAPKFPLQARLLFPAAPAATIIGATTTAFNASDLDSLAPDGTAGDRLELSRVGKPIDPSQEVGFNIYRSTDPNLPKKQWERLNVTLLSQPEFNDTTRRPGVRYYYYVTSVNAFGVESQPSEVF
jgi:hypothetical protein